MTVRGVVISFRPMRDDEFSDYLSCFVSNYTQEIVENYKVSPEIAAAQVKSELDSDLTNGPETEGQYLFCILQEDPGLHKHIGYIWYSRKQGADQIFVCDFLILPPYRGQGLGTLTLASLDLHLEKLGVSQIRLRVAAENKIAFRAYESSGFQVTGTNMFKKISKDRSVE